MEMIGEVIMRVAVVLIVAIVLLTAYNDPGGPGFA